MIVEQILQKEIEESKTWIDREEEERERRECCMKILKLML
jgi:hypothetical protein